MKIIIPMAGMGKRMRPHTLTTPKPLLPIAGKPIVERLVNSIAAMLDNTAIEEVAFIIGDFGKEVEDNLIDIANRLGYVGKIYYQKEALGTAHAIYCAKDSLNGNIFIAYADTLFHTGFKINVNEEGIIWTKKIDDPTLFGVVKHNKQGYVTDFVEKSAEFISDLAIIGLYYFREGESLRNEIKFLLDNDITGNGEYQITDALENMKNKGMKIKVAEVEGWFDCGNKDATVSTNKEILKLSKDENLISEKSEIEGSIILEPVFIDDEVRIINSKIGPYVSIGNGTIIEDSVIANSIILSKSHVKNASLDNSMLGNYVKYNGDRNEVSLGDFSERS